MDSVINAVVKGLKTGDVSDFDCKDLLAQVRANEYQAPAIAVGGYLIVIFGILPLVRPAKCPTFISRHLFAMWNLFLSAFSWVGVFAAVPYVFIQIKEKGFKHMVCSDEMMLGTPEDDPSSLGYIGLMMTLFMLSKFPELLDTFFLVYSKKPLLFLHWYHHITVLMYSWYAYSIAVPSSVIFATVNYCVHAVMYFYFGASIYTKKLGFMRKPITSIQLLQMAWGISLTVIAYLYTHGIIGDGNCSPVYKNSQFFWSCAGMYGSYFVLFMKLYIDNYTGKKKKSSTNGSVKASDKGSSKRKKE